MRDTPNDKSKGEKMEKLNEKLTLSLWGHPCIEIQLF